FRLGYRARVTEPFEVQPVSHEYILVGSLTRRRYNGSLWPDSVSSATAYGHASIDCHYRWAASTESTELYRRLRGRSESEATTMSLTATMMRVHEPGASLVADRIAVEEPGPRSVRVQVTASGMCHADIGTAAATGASGGAGALLREVGGADVIISTASTTEPVAELTQGLRARGRLVVLGADGGSIPVPSGQLVADAQSITGHITGSPLDIEEAMSFALLNGIRPIIERAPLEEANRELHRLQNGEPRFRIVLDASADRAGNA